MLHNGRPDYQRRLRALLYGAQIETACRSPHGRRCEPEPAPRSMLQPRGDRFDLPLDLTPPDPEMVNPRVINPITTGFCAAATSPLSGLSSPRRHSNWGATACHRRFTRRPNARAGH